ncbi:hypothetical protein D3C72_2350720 [compost metagenome]
MRLGFSHQTMAEWLAKYGMSVERTEDLPPGSTASRGLTVTIWLARKGGETSEAQLSGTAAQTGSR